MSAQQETPSVSSKQRQKNSQNPKQAAQVQRKVNLNDTEDQKTFRNACNELWSTLYEVDTMARNHPFYHSCCNSFSKRNFFAGQHSHPEECTFRLIDWVKIHEISDAEDFHDHLFEETKKKPTDMQTLPMLNLHHTSDDSMQKMFISLQDRVSTLEKRNSQLEAELDQSRKNHDQTKVKLAELEERLQKETERREFAELVNEVNRKLEKQQNTKVHFDYDTRPQKSIKKY